MRTLNCIRALLAVSVVLNLATSVHAQAISGQGNWETTLQARDIGNTGTTNAFYDTALGVTWLSNANVNGLMDWSTANTWANSLTVNGVSNWRLPTTGVALSGNNITSSEMGYLFYAELGNAAGSLTNTGGFANVQSYAYWSGTEYAPGSIDAWYFYPSTGSQDHTGKSSYFWAMAVHPGDIGSPVSPVPEPETYAMLLAGLGLMAFTLRSRRGVSANVPLPRFKDQGRDATGVPIF